MSTPRRSWAIWGLMPTPPNNRSAHDLQMFAVNTETGVDLRGQFAGWSQHQGAGSTAWCWGSFQAFKDWQGKTCRLAGACLSACKKVDALQHQRNSLELDWSWDFVAGFAYGTD